ncbi:MAG: hypothetical protein ABF593_08755 [Acetobacter papayae]|uniref:hypothetical protein n=1 Tax=Acetobacter papayae TaxID=1076592 RepID=UPI0039E9A2DE
MQRLAQAMTLTLPLFLLRGRAIADGIISGVALLFVLHCLLTGDRSWRQGWCIPAFLFWGVAILSSIMHGTTHAVAEAFALGRFILFCAALESWVFGAPGGPRGRGVAGTRVALWGGGGGFGGAVGMRWLGGSGPKEKRARGTVMGKAIA